MRVVAAGMHEGNSGSIVFVFDEYGAGVGELGLFIYGEGVHVCAEEDGGIGPVV